jgi:hypothetical protein
MTNIQSRKATYVGKLISQSEIISMGYRLVGVITTFGNKNTVAVHKKRKLSY